jgi:hypothetical protein
LTARSTALFMRFPRFDIASEDIRCITLFCYEH